MRRLSRTAAFIAGACTVMAGTAVAQIARQQFPDVLPSAYYYDAVERLARYGIITGYSDGRFGPQHSVTRGQVAVMLDRYDRQVVETLRNQMEQLRAQLNLGNCGDGVQQHGEECDDANRNDGDGCSSECLTEFHCAGGYRIGETFTAPDGCNTCTCTEGGVACTELACLQKKCFSTSDCPSGKVCSTEQGDCRFPCPEGAVCIAACAGVCITPSTSYCGDGVCNDGEIPYVDRSGVATYCPQDCESTGPVCGDGICEELEEDEYDMACTENVTPCVAVPVLVRRGSCPEDCADAATQCEHRLASVRELFAEKRSCESDADCTVFVRSCSPFQTCGEAVRYDALLEVTSTVFDYTDACPDAAGTQECFACSPNSAACINGQCEVRLAQTTP